MSRWPNVATTLSVPALTAASSVTSIATPIALPPAAVISAATLSAASWLMSAMATLAPCFAYNSAIALPRPLAAPVIRATLPFMSVMHRFLLREENVGNGHPLTGFRAGPVVSSAR